MAHIQKRNGKWQARYRGPDGKERTRRFERKVDAENWLVTNGADIARGLWIDPLAGKATLQGYSKGWEASQVGRPATLALIDNAVRVHILPALGARAMSSIRPTDIQGFIKGLAGKYSPGTVRNIYDITARMFSSAVDDRVVAVSPCRNVSLPRLDDAEVTPPSVEEITAVVAAMPDRSGALRSCWPAQGSGSVNSSASESQTSTFSVVPSGWSVSACRPARSGQRRPGSRSAPYRWLPWSPTYWRRTWRPIRRGSGCSSLKEANL